jgi:hypothetical protein
MRAAAVVDAWRNVQKLGKYPSRLIAFKANNIEGFKAEVELSFSSAVTAVCGKNGVGKTTLIKFLYSAFNGETISDKHVKFESSSFEAKWLISGNEIITIDKAPDGLVAYYLEPSRDCTKIVEYLKSTSNVEELLEGVEKNNSFNDPAIKKSIEHLIGKSYKSLAFYEVADAMPHELGYSFPYFEVVLNNGSTYSNVDMGMGEFSCLYVVWFLSKFIESRSFLFIEEPENFISAYSQTRLMDFIAAQSFSQKIWVMLSTHSEHILSKVGIENVRVISQFCTDGRSGLSNPKHVKKYLSALGLSANVVGIFAVEDDVARYFLEYILDKYDSDILNDYAVIQMRCDSNIEKIVKHFEPTPSPDFEIIAVLDADQSAQIKELCGRHIYITALPSLSALTPELELWPVLVESVGEVAVILDLDETRLLEAVEDQMHSDHHDRFSRIAASCRKNKRDVVHAVMRVWYGRPENQILVRKFCLAIKSRRTKVVCQKNSDDIFEIKNVEYVESLGLENCLIDAGVNQPPYIERFIGFNGVGFFC